MMSVKNVAYVSEGLAVNQSGGDKTERGIPYFDEQYLIQIAFGFHRQNYHKEMNGTRFKNEPNIF